jgi:hypothetical protein
MKTEAENIMDESSIRDLITKRMAAEDADSGWAIAYTALLFLPVLQSIDRHLESLGDLGVLGEWERRMKVERMAQEEAIWQAKQKRERR